MRHILRTVAALCVIVVTAPAWAQAEPCADRDRMVERLAAHYQEVPAGRGLQARDESQALIEVWASRETGTFTVMQTLPNGVACVLATGTNWQFGVAEPRSGDRSS